MLLFVESFRGRRSLDLKMWVQFLSQFNDRTQFPSLVRQEGDALQFYSDSSHGCGVVFDNHWSFFNWPVIYVAG